MRTIPLIGAILLLISACGLNQQTKKLKALADCTYRIHSIDAVDLAGADVLEMMQTQRLDFAQMPRLALGFLSQDIPLQAKLTFEVINPSKQIAEIQEFDYEVRINDYLLTEGTYDQIISIPAQDTSYIPIEVGSNVYSILANDSLRNEIQDFILSAKSGTEQTASLELKVKPGIKMGEKLVKYPSFITFKRAISNQALLQSEKF